MAFAKNHEIVTTVLNIAQSAKTRIICIDFEGGNEVGKVISHFALL